MRRSFLIEICANSGSVLGTATVADTYEDMCLVVGRSFVNQVLPRERRAWKLGLLFAHIVRERTSIDMMHGGDRDYGFDNDARRVGVLDNSSTTGSIIRIHRDNDDDDREEAQQRGETSSGDGTAAASSDTKTATAVAAVAASSSSSHRHQRQWFRIHARTHRMFGCPLRSVVLLLTTDRTSPLFFSDTEQFFRRGGGQACISSSSSSDSGGQALLQQFDVLFRCKNSFTKEVRELLVPSLELSSWLSVGGGSSSSSSSAVVVDLTTSYRRDKLGSFLLDYVSFRYLPDGCIDLYLVREDAQVTSSIDQLMEEDEQRQLEDENRTTF